MFLSKTAPSIVLLAACLWAPFAQAADLRTDRFGTRIYVSSGGHFEIDNIVNNTIGTVNAGYRGLSWVGGCQNFAGNVTYDTQIAASLFPLVPGTTTTLETARDAQRWKVDFSIGHPEQVTVSAGQFSTIPVTVNERSTVGTFHGETKCWYAPEVGFSVKREHRVIAGTDQGRLTEWQAVKVEIKDRGSKAEFVPPDVGVRYVTSLNVGYHVNKIDGTKIIVGTTPTNQLVGGLHLMSVNNLEADARDRDYRRIWPLEVGKKISFLYNSGQATGRYTLEVEGMETIATPLGRLNTFRISETLLNASTRKTFVTRTWYSPGIRFIAKQEFEYPPTDKAPENWVMNSVLVAPVGAR
jgi:hypothetical protein